MFYEILDEVDSEMEWGQDEGTSRPHLDDAMGWTANFNPRMPEPSGIGGGAASHFNASTPNFDNRMHVPSGSHLNASPASPASPQVAHGPRTYGAFHIDPYGPADKDEDPPARPPTMFDPASPSLAMPENWQRGKGYRHGSGSTSHKNVNEELQAPPVKREHDDVGVSSGTQLRTPTGVRCHMAERACGDGSSEEMPHEHQRQAAPLSESIPMWAYETLPRDCLIMLLETALKHMPQEAAVVAQCMRSLAPMTRDEYQRCFMSRDSPAAPAAACQPPPRELPSAAPAPRLLSVDTRRVAPECGASAGCWSPGPASVKVNGDHEGKGERVHLPRCGSPPTAGKNKAHSPTVSGQRGGGEARRSIFKPAARSNIRLTDSRSGKRTSILTEEQAIQVFKLRPQHRTERAALCLELAERYSVTTTAIRHIWDRRTWVWTNISYWTEAEMAASMAEGTCDSCKDKKVTKIQDTCQHCPINRRRGRPRGARDTYRRQRKTPAGGGDDLEDA